MKPNELENNNRALDKEKTSSIIQQWEKGELLTNYQKPNIWGKPLPKRWYLYTIIGLS